MAIGRHLDIPADAGSAPARYAPVSRIRACARTIRSEPHGEQRLDAYELRTGR